MGNLKGRSEKKTATKRKFERGKFSDKGKEEKVFTPRAQKFRELRKTGSIEGEAKKTNLKQVRGGHRESTKKQEAGGLLEKLERGKGRRIQGHIGRVRVYLRDSKKLKN